MKEQSMNLEGGFFGMYLKRITNKSSSNVYFTVREYPNKSLALRAGEKRKPADIPLPWVSNVNDEGKCILIEITDKNQEILLWDDKGSGAFFTKNGQWDPQARKVFGNASSWGDYELTIEANGDLEMKKIG